MKKFVALLLSTLLLSLIMVGCIVPTQQDPDLSKLQNQLDAIANDIADLQSRLEETNDAVSQSDTATPPSESEPASDAAPSSNQKVLADYDLASLAAEVDIIVAKMENATVDNMFDIKTEGDALDRQISTVEDSAEHDYRQGLLSREDYRSVDTEAERLEDALDLAEDKMEIRLGFDD